MIDVLFPFFMQTWEIEQNNQVLENQNTPRVRILGIIFNVCHSWNEPFRNFSLSRSGNYEIDVASLTRLFSENSAGLWCITKDITCILYPAAALQFWCQLVLNATCMMMPTCRRTREKTTLMGSERGPNFFTLRVRAFIIEAGVNSCVVSLLWSANGKGDALDSTEDLALTFFCSCEW